MPGKIAGYSVEEKITVFGEFVFVAEMGIGVGKFPLTTFHNQINELERKAMAQQLKKKAKTI